MKCEQRCNSKNSGSECRRKKNNIIRLSLHITARHQPINNQRTAMRINRHKSDEKFRALINLNSSVLYVLFVSRVYFVVSGIAGHAISAMMHLHSICVRSAHPTRVHRECKCDCAFIDRMNSDPPERRVFAKISFDSVKRWISIVVSEFNKLHRFVTRARGTGCTQGAHE